MRTKSSRAAREGMAVAANLMLAPMVMWMRMPIMAMEKRPSTGPGIETLRAINEKTAAVAEGAWAAQMSLFESAARFWPEMLAGQTPAALSGAAAERAFNAALKPAGRAVKANYRRLATKRS